MDENISTKSARDPRFTVARAVAISLVLAAHLEPFEVPLTEGANIIVKGLALAIQQFYWQVTRLAVPMLLLVSLYLLFGKFEELGAAYLGKRLRRLGGISAFWIGCQFSVYYAISAIRSVGSGKPISWSLPGTSIIKLLMQGGPPLAEVGSSVFYFLFVLLIFTPLCFLFFTGRNVRWLLPILEAAIILGSLAYFELRNLNGQGAPFWRVDNFLVYIPIAYILRKMDAQSRHRISPYLYIFFLLLTLQDIYLRRLGWNLGNYSRVSIVVGATAILSSLLTQGNLAEPGIVTFLSTFSLGIFAMHKYWQFIVTILAKDWGVLPRLSTIGFLLELAPLVTAIVVTLLTCASTYLIGQTRLRRLVM